MVEMASVWYPHVWRNGATHVIEIVWGSPGCTKIVMTMINQWIMVGGEVGGVRWVGEVGDGMGWGDG